MNKYVKEFFKRAQKHFIAVPTEIDEIYIKLYTENFLTKIEVLDIIKQNKIDKDIDSIKREVCAAVFKEYAIRVGNNKAHLVSYMLDEPSIQHYGLQPIDFVKYAMEMDYSVFKKQTPMGKVGDYMITTMWSENCLALCLRTLNHELGLKLDINDFTEIDHLP